MIPGKCTHCNRVVSKGNCGHVMQLELKAAGGG
jgi:hypothetical protein